MALDNAKNFAKVTVSTGYDAAATSIVLQTGHGAKLPTAPCNVIWWDATTYPDPSDDPNVEIVRVTSISTDTLTVTRAQESTSASTKNTAGKTYRMIAGLTAKVINTDMPAAFGGAWELVSYTTGTGSTFDVSSLDLATDLAYKVIWQANITNSGNHAITCAMQWNGVTTSSYHSVLQIGSYTSSYTATGSGTAAAQYILLTEQGSNTHRVNFGEILFMRSQINTVYEVFCKTESAALYSFDGSNNSTNYTGSGYADTGTISNLTSIRFASYAVTGTPTIEWKVWVFKPATA